jgi:hypothetical protein
VIGIALSGSALNMASAHWGIAFLTMTVTIIFSVRTSRSGRNRNWRWGCWRRSSARG